jgi:hypothetical protein
MLVQQAVKALGTTFFAFLEAAKALGLTGRLVGGARVWTRDEVEKIGLRIANK